MKTITLKEEKIHSGNLILVNAQYPFKEVRTGSFVPVSLQYSNVLLTQDAASVLLLVLNMISAEKFVVPISGYRSLEEQKEIYNHSMCENGENFTRKFVALPNHSEHQTGLAIDLALRKEKIDFICPEFPYEGICNEFRRLAPNYGFIERYAKEKEEITGISHEPWHFRYVGFPHSKIIEDKKLSLEEYIEFLKDYQGNDRFIFLQKSKGEIEICYTHAYDHKTALAIPEKSNFQISGNNIDGFITTVWRNSNE